MVVAAFPVLKEVLSLPALVKVPFPIFMLHPMEGICERVGIEFGFIRGNLNGGPGSISIAARALANFYVVDECFDGQLILLGLFPYRVKRPGRSVAQGVGATGLILSGRAPRGSRPALKLIPAAGGAVTAERNGGRRRASGLCRRHVGNRIITILIIGNRIRCCSPLEIIRAYVTAVKK